MSKGTAYVASRLPDMVGAEHVLTDISDRATYEVDGVRPSAVVRPGTSAEIVEILRFAAADGLAVIPMGGRTKLGIGMPPRQFDLALDLSRLNRVLAYDPRDLTCGVETGVLFADLDRQLATERQFLPLAPAFAGRATLGGIIAAGADSPFRHAYGSARDYLLGMEFITGDGVFSKSGGSVVKNVTGYDLHKLLIGSLGTLAVITRLNFRTFPLPPAQQTFLASFATAPEALSFCAAIAKSPLQPKLVEVLDRGTARLFAAQGCTRAAGDAWSTVITAAGQQSVVERHARDLERMAGHVGASGFAPLNDSEQAVLLGCISEFPRVILEAFPKAAIFRIAALPAAMPDLLRQISAALERQRLDQATLVRAAGVVYFAMLEPTSRETADENVPNRSDADKNAADKDGADKDADVRLVTACGEIMKVGLAAGLRPMIEWCPLSVKRELRAAGGSVWPPPGDEHFLAERLKKVFDPHGILAPGRFQGGI
jgi:glycolate oxidase FAD binding subunit